MFWLLFLSSSPVGCLDSSPQQQFMVFNLHFCPSFPVWEAETLMLYARLPASPQAAPDCSSHSGCISSPRELGVHPVSSWDLRLRAAGCGDTPLPSTHIWTHSPYISPPFPTEWTLLFLGKHSLLSIFPPAEPEQTPFMHIPGFF